MPGPKPTAPDGFGPPILTCSSTPIVLPNLQTMHARTLMPLALAGALFTGCSKQETPTPAESTGSVPSPETAATSEDSGSVRFAIPGGDTGSPTTARERLVDAAQQPAGAATGTKIDQAELLAYFPPFYPLPLRMEGVEGTIDVVFRVDAAGMVSEVRVLGATASEFTEYAVEAVQKWRFVPANQDGAPVPVIIRMKVPFISEFGSDPGALVGSPLARMAFLDGRYYIINEDGKYVPADADPVPVRRVHPARPPEVTWGENLRVTLTLTVNEVGRVLEPAIQETSGDASFDQAAMEAVRFWQFLPRLRDGNPLSSRAQLPIIFAVEDEAG